MKGMLIVPLISCAILGCGADGSSGDDAGHSSDSSLDHSIAADYAIDHFTAADHSIGDDGSMTDTCTDGSCPSEGCKSDKDCAPQTPHCLMAAGQCVQCRTLDDCANPLPVCDVAAYSCRGCKDSSECAGSPGGWMCRVDDGHCVSCLNDDHCLPPTPMCDVSLGKCVSCGGDDDCDDPTPRCDLVGGGCVECLKDEDCKDPGDVCSVDHHCVECVVDDDCKSPDKPLCSPFTGKCGECVVDDDCNTGGKPACDQDAGECVACLGPWDCIFPSPNCDVSTNTCVECVTGANCPAGEPICADENFCVECLEDADCGPDAPRCDELNHRCVLCKSDADCHPDQPLCATAFGTCNACLYPNGCPSGQKCFFAMCKPTASGPDKDDDTVADSEDNCPDNSNWSQDDMDGDGTGDACDTDIDGDLVTDSQDNCPYIKNPGQEDQDGDGWGDACEGSGVGGDKGRTCATLGFDTAVQFLESFESGKFFGWIVYSGISGSWTGSSVMNYIPPQVVQGSAHNGLFGARFPNVSWPNEVNHDAFLTLCMPLGAKDRLSVWVRPDNVGYCCGPYGTAAFNISFLKGTQGYSISYSWSYSSNKDSKTHRFVRLSDAPYSWVKGQWNHLDVVLQDELGAYFGITDFKNVMITKVHVYNHYSNGSPKGFDIDDIELLPMP